MITDDPFDKYKSRAGRPVARKKRTDTRSAKERKKELLQQRDEIDAKLDKAESFGSEWHRLVNAKSRLNVKLKELSPAHGGLGSAKFRMDKVNLGRDELISLVIDKLAFINGGRLPERHKVRRDLCSILSELFPHRLPIGHRIVFSDIEKIFNYFELYKENISVVIRKHIKYDLFNEPNYDSAKAALIKELERKFPGGIKAELAAAIFMHLHNLQSIKQNLEQSSVSKGTTFEQQCADVLREAGFSVETTSKTGDFGVDVIARKQNISCAIQCKDHSKPIGVSAVQQAESGRKFYVLDFAVVVSRSGFTPAAKELGARSNVLLIGPKGLQNLEILLNSLY